MRLSRKIMKTQYTDEFGGYSKTWFNDGIEEMTKPGKDMILDNDDDYQIEPVQTDQYGMDNLARSLGLDIEAIAIALAMVEDKPPT